MNTTSAPSNTLFHLSRIPSPMGELLLVTDDQEKVRALDFTDHKTRLYRLLRTHYGRYELTEGPAPAVVATALADYFNGDLDAVHRIATATAGSEFERRTWNALLDIPSGQTTSYGKLAKTLGFDDPRAAIDIGAAVGANPVCIITPCHRVIGSNGDIKGYAGGVHRKRWLLEHEGVLKKPAETAAVSEEPRLPGF
jgi:methylated-DNA-[protein]-cysteine S-methyltransferase